MIQDEQPLNKIPQNLPEAERFAADFARIFSTTIIPTNPTNPATLITIGKLEERP